MSTKTDKSTKAYRETINTIPLIYVAGDKNMHYQPENCVIQFDLINGNKAKLNDIINSKSIFSVNLFYTDIINEITIHAYGVISQEFDNDIYCTATNNNISKNKMILLRSEHFELTSDNMNVMFGQGAGIYSPGAGFGYATLKLLNYQK